MANWLYQCAGMHIVKGIAQKATNGYLGVDDQGMVYLYDNNQQVFDQAPAAQCEVKTGIMGNFIKMNGQRYTLEFHSLGRAVAGGLLGGAIGGLIAGNIANGEDTRTEKEKRDQFAAVVAQFRGQV